MKRRNKAWRFAAALAALLLAAAAGAQLWLVHGIQTHLPRAVAFDDTRLLEEGWAAAQSYTEGTDVGLCTLAVPLRVTAQEKETTLPYCRANGAFAAAEALDLTAGAFWSDTDAAPVVVLPEAAAVTLGVAVGDALTVDGTLCTVAGLYRPWRLPGTPGEEDPVYGNFLSTEREAAQTTLRVVVPLPGDTQEGDHLYTLFQQENLGPYGRSVNLKNWGQLVEQLLWLELLAVLLLPAFCLTARGIQALCQLILPAEGRPARRNWASAGMLALAPLTVWSFLLAQTQIPGEFLPGVNLFDVDHYAQIAQGAAMFATGGFGFSPATAQYLMALRMVALLALPVVVLGWAFTVPAACGAFRRRKPARSAPAWQAAWTAHTESETTQEIVLLKRKK